MNPFCSDCRRDSSRYRCDALTNWAIKPLTLGAGHLLVLMSPWGMNVKWFMKCFIYWTADVKSSTSYDPCSYERNLCNCVRRSLKTQDFNGVWSRDLTIPVRRSNQVSYEATDVESWSFLGSNEPVRNECEWMSNDIWNVSYIELRIRHQVSYDPRSYERNLCNCVYRSLKKSGLNGVSKT